MYAMAMERFKAWREVKGSVRPNIIYYRDGVSTGQYADVLSDEVAAIKRAWTDLFRKDSDSGKTDEVKVTAIIGVKRHHTRFFPLDKDAHKNGNCKAGTLVDQGIVSPFFTEFFLQSHHALHGTAIPTRYFVLENGLRFSDTDIQNFVSPLPDLRDASLTHPPDTQALLHIRPRHNGSIVRSAGKPLPYQTASKTHH
jgi:eukaryotic translation initiation factor 2C